MKEGYCCQSKMEKIFKEVMGESYFCVVCGTVVSVSFDKDTFEVEKEKKS